jgi:hypothetical protein
MNDVERIRAAPTDRVAALLGHGFPGRLVEKLAEMPRFAPRLQAAVASRLGDLPPIDARQIVALALDEDGLRRITLRAGAVWHAAALARLVDGAARRGAIASLGPDAYALALESRALGSSGGSADLPQGDLAGAAAVDGECCWAAWCAMQPAPLKSRLSLLARDVSPLAAHMAFGPAIIGWLLDRA